MAKQVSGVQRNKAPASNDAGSLPAPVQAASRLGYLVSDSEHITVRMTDANIRLLAVLNKLIGGEVARGDKSSTPPLQLLGKLEWNHDEQRSELDGLEALLTELEAQVG